MQEQRSPGISGAAQRGRFDSWKITRMAIIRSTAGQFGWQESTFRPLLATVTGVTIACVSINRVELLSSLFPGSAARGIQTKEPKPRSYFNTMDRYCYQSTWKIFLFVEDCASSSDRFVNTVRVKINWSRRNRKYGNITNDDTYDC